MRFPLRARLALGLAAIALVLVAPLALALASLERQADLAESLRDRDFSASLLLGRIRGSTDDLRRMETALLYVRTPEMRDSMSALVGRLHAMADSLAHYDLDSAAHHVRAGIVEVSAAAPREYGAALDGRLSEAEAISANEVRPAIGRVERWIGAAERSLRERTGARVHEVATEAARARRLALAALLIAAVIAAVISLWLSRSISRPVRALEQGMQAVADGDLDHSVAIPVDRTDEFGRLASSYESMRRQLAELDKLKAEFVSIASHELKTPIHVISGYAALLREGIYGALAPAQVKVITAIDQQAQMLARLVKQLMDVSRFRAGGGKLEPRPIDTDAFLARFEMSFEGLALQKGITWSVERGPGVPSEVCWDEDRMNEVLGNLLSNAFKFTERGGRVTLRADAADGMVVMDVSDSGAGIPPDQLPHIFEKFYQASNQSEATSGGSGLGLAITKEIVEAHGGSITVESTPGVGTTFVVTLPTSVQRRRSSVPEAVVA